MTISQTSYKRIRKHQLDEQAQRVVEHERAAQRDIYKEAAKIIFAPRPDAKHTHHEDDHGRFSDDGCPHHSED